MEPKFTFKAAKVVSWRNGIANILYAFGLLLLPVIGFIGGIFEKLEWHVWPGPTPGIHPGLGVYLLVGYFVCAAGALTMKKGLIDKTVFILLPLIILPLEIPLMGVLLIFIFGLDGIR